MDGRIVLMATLATVIWFLNAFFQRRSAFYARVKVPCLLAFTLGSRDCFVIWSTMAVQVAALMSLITYVGSILVFNISTPVLAVLAGMLLGVAIKILKPKRGHA